MVVEYIDAHVESTDARRVRHVARRAASAPLGADGLEATTSTSRVAAVGKASNDGAVAAAPTRARLATLQASLRA